MQHYSQNKKEYCSIINVYYRSMRMSLNYNIDLEYWIIVIKLPQRGRKSETVKSLPEAASPIWWWSWAVDFSVKRAGRSGLESLVVSVFNIRTTSDMVGLLFASSWTHNNPICMYRRNSSGLLESFSNGSINSNLFSSFHSSQAYNKYITFKHVIYQVLSLW